MYDSGARSLGRSGSAAQSRLFDQRGFDDRQYGGPRPRRGDPAEADSDADSLKSSGAIVARAIGATYWGGDRGGTPTPGGFCLSEFIARGLTEKNSAIVRFL
jgi:hypothetical protein